jgi:YD repeat-containing protein
VLTDFQYDYDEPSPGTRKTQLRQSVTDEDGNTTRYGYDALDRLTSAVERNSLNTTIDDRA